MKMVKCTLTMFFLFFAVSQTLWASDGSLTKGILKVETQQLDSGLIEYRYQFSKTIKNGKQQLVLQSVCLNDEPDYEKKVNMRSAKGPGAGLGFMIEPPKIMKFKKLELYSDSKSNKPMVVRSIYQPKFVTYSITHNDSDGGPLTELEKGITVGPACNILDKM